MRLKSNILFFLKYIKKCLLDFNMSLKLKRVSPLRQIDKIQGRTYRLYFGNNKITVKNASLITWKQFEPYIESTMFWLDNQNFKNVSPLSLLDKIINNFEPDAFIIFVETFKKPLKKLHYPIKKNIHGMEISSLSRIFLKIMSSMSTILPAYNTKIIQDKMIKTLCNHFPEEFHDLLIYDINSCEAAWSWVDTCVSSSRPLYWPKFTYQRLLEFDNNLTIILSHPDVQNNVLEKVIATSRSMHINVTRNIKALFEKWVLYQSINNNKNFQNQKKRRM